MELDYFDWTAFVLATMGAINLGLIGLGQFSGEGSETYNLINILAQYTIPGIEAIVYILIGLAGLYQVYLGFQLFEK